MSAVVSRTPAEEQKLLVETLKAKVARLQAETGEKRASAQGTFPRRSELFRSWEAAKRVHKAAVEELQAAKLVLSRLSGTTGADPKWQLLREAWHLLNRLEESGIDIGDEGHSLLDEIEFHVPAAKLHQDIAAGPHKRPAEDK